MPIEASAALYLWFLCHSLFIVKYLQKKRFFGECLNVFRVKIFLIFKGKSE